MSDVAGPPPGKFLDALGAQELRDEVRKDVDQILMALYDLLLAVWRQGGTLPKPAPHRDKVPNRLLYWFDVRYDYWAFYSPPAGLTTRLNWWISQATAVRDDSARIANLLRVEANERRGELAWDSPSTTVSPETPPAIANLIVLRSSGEPPKAPDEEIQEALDAVDAAIARNASAAHEAPERRGTKPPPRDSSRP